MPSSDGSAASAAALVNTTRCPRDPDGGRSDLISTIVNTPRNGSRFGCPSTSGISIAILSNSTEFTSIPFSSRCTLGFHTELHVFRSHLYEKCCHPERSEGPAFPDVP